MDRYKDWDYARNNGLTILSKDADFSHRVVLTDTGPHVIHIRVGNLTIRDLHEYLTMVWTGACRASEVCRLVQVYRDRIESIGLEAEMSTEGDKPSATYILFREAIQREKQVSCVYQRLYRELCPHIIGHKNGVEKVLAYQFGGESKGKLPNWRCLELAEVRDARLRDGDWHEGAEHRTQQTCVTDVDLDINIHVRTRRKG